MSERAASKVVSGAMKRVLVLGLLLACDETKPAGTAPTATAPMAAATPSAAASSAPSVTVTAAPATPAPLSERLKCTSLLTDNALTAASLANMKVTQVPATCAECGPTCTLTAPGKPFEGVTVKYDCRTKQPKDEMDKELKKLSSELKKGGPIAGLGRGAVGGERESGMFYTVLAYDDDSNCSIHIDWMRGKKNDAQNVAKVAIAGVKQADLP